MTTDILKLIGRILVETSLKKELLIPVDGDYGSVGEIKEGSPLFTEVANLIGNALRRPEDHFAINLGMFSLSIPLLLC